MVNGIKFANNVTGIESLNLLPYQSDLDLDSYPTRASGLQPQEDGGAFTGQAFHHSYIRPFKFQDDVTLNGNASIPILTLNAREFIGQASNSNKVIISTFNIITVANLPNFASYSGFVGAALRVIIRNNAQTNYTATPYLLYQQNARNANGGITNSYPANPYLQLSGNGTDTPVYGPTQTILNSDDTFDITANYAFPFGTTTELYLRGLILYNTQ